MSNSVSSQTRLRFSLIGLLCIVSGVCVLAAALRIDLLLGSITLAAMTSLYFMWQRKWSDVTMSVCTVLLMAYCIVVLLVAA